MYSNLPDALLAVALSYAYMIVVHGLAVVGVGALIKWIFF